MLEAILEAPDSYPPHLHRHLLQLYLVKHREPPTDERERRRAVFEYLTRAQRDTTRRLRIHLSPPLEAWLRGDDERAVGWGPVPRIGGLIHQFSRDIRKRYDLAVERDYKEFACFVAFTLRDALRWPDSTVCESFHPVLWEPAPGISSVSRIGVTRAMNYIRRKASGARDLDLGKIADYSRLLLRILSDVDEGKLPPDALSPIQYEYLSRPVDLKRSKLRLTGLLHHLVVERGMVSEAQLAQPNVVAMVQGELPRLLQRLRLPRPLREAHGMSVPAIELRVPPAAPESRVTVVGPLSSGSGLGAAARACADAFQAAGYPVDVLNHVAGWGRTDENAGAGLVDRVRGDINVVHFNPDVLFENLSRCGIDQFRGRYNIGFGFWETSRACLAHRLGLDFLDELWVSSEYCRELFQAATDKPVLLMRTPIPRLGDLGWASRACFGLPEDAFTFVFTFDGASRITRKNPMAVIRAFRRAFPSDDGVRLVIKTQNTHQLSMADERSYAEIRRVTRRDRRIVIIDESFSSNEVHGLISVSDCYVSLHRSEGFGFGMAEAMMLRVPVIATAYSGNVDFTSEATAYSVRHRLVPVPPQDFVYRDDGQEWADPDVDHAAERMLEVRSDPAGRAARVEAAAAFVEAEYDPRAIGAAYRARIEEIRTGRGAAPAIAA